MSQTPELNIGGATLAEPTETPVAETRPMREPKPADAQGWWWDTGRSKTAVTRVRLRPAKGETDDVGGPARIKIQRATKVFIPVDKQFTEERDRADIVAPLKLTETIGKVEVFVRVHGGGLMGQAQAIRLGIARALVNYDPTTEESLRDAGYLTRDAREVERKKYGQAGARRRFQFSKR